MRLPLQTVVMVSWVFTDLQTLCLLALSYPRRTHHFPTACLYDGYLLSHTLHTPGHGSTRHPSCSSLPFYFFFNEIFRTCAAKGPMKTHFFAWKILVQDGYHLYIMDNRQVCNWFKDLRNTTRFEFLLLLVNNNSCMSTALRSHAASLQQRDTASKA